MRWLFTPPLFADEEQTQTARQLYVILWTIILTVIIAVVLDLIILPEMIGRWLSLLVGINMPCLILLNLTWRGQTRLVSRLLVLFLWGIVTVMAFTGGGIFTPAVNAYVLIVFIAGLLLGTRMGIITAVVCSLTNFGLVCAARAGVLPPRTVEHNQFLFWTALTFYLVIIVGLQYLAAQAIKKSLRRAQQELAERRQTEAALRESEARYRSLFEGVPIGLYRTTPAGQILNANPAMAQMLGYPDHETLLMVNAADFYVDTAARQQFLMQLEHEGQVHDYEVQMQRRDGTLIWVRLNSRAVRDDQGRILYLEGSLEDITARKRAEESLRESEARLRQITDNMVDLIAQFDGQAHFQYVSPSYEKILGYRPEELLGKWAPEFIHPDEKDEMLQAIDTMLRSGAGSVQFRYRHKDGSYRWFESTGRTLLNAEGQMIGSIMGSRDITDRKQAEEELRLSESFLNSIINQSPYSMWISDDKGTFIRLNQACRDLLHITDEEVIGKYNVLKDNIVEEQGFLPLVKRVFETGETARFEIKYDSSQVKHLQLAHFASVILDVTIFPIRDANGEITNAVIQHVDITERKRAGEALRESEEKYRLIAENVTDVIWTTDLTLKPVYISPAIEKLRGYTVEEALQQPFETTLTPASLEYARQTLQTGLEREKTGVKEARFGPIALEYTCKDGSTVWAESSITYMRDAAGQLIGFIGVTRNITVRRQAMAALAETQALLRSVIEQSPVPMVVAVPDGTVTIFNQACLEILGLADEADIKPGLNIFTMKRSWQDLDAEGQPIPPHEAPLALALQGKTTKGREMKARRKDGTERWEVVNGVPIYDKAGNLIAGLIIFPDNTERKQAEEELQASERQLSLIYNNVSDVIYYLAVEPDDRFRFLSINPAFLKATGLVEKQIVGKLVQEVIPEPAQALVIGSYKKAIREKRTIQWEETSVYPTGKKIGIVSITPIFDADGTCTHLIGTVQDITERKQAEEELTNIKAMLEAAFEQTPIPMALVSMPDGVLRIINSAILEFLGVLDEPTPIGQRLADFKPSYQDYDAQGNLTPLSEAPLALALQGQRTLNQERRIVAKNGTTRWALVSSNPIYNVHGDLIAAYIIFPDITERKRAEEQLQASLKEKEALIRELYHRTKNNMQVICAMLELQSDYTQNEQVTQVFKEMDNRIRSMALVHQMLYQSQNLSSINLKEYISDLADLLIGSYNISPRKISLKLDLEDVFILIDMAVPCGLILNELISNAFKHAFPGDKMGEITVRLHRREADMIELAVADNGVGVPAGFDFRKHGKMGVQTILALGERQLQGEVKFDSPPGFTCFIRFRDTLYSARV